MSIADIVAAALNSERGEILNASKDEVEALPFGQKLKAFAELENYRRELEETLKAVKETAAEIEPQLREEMALADMQSANVEGLTIYLHRTRYVSKKSDKDGVTSERLCGILRDIGWGDLVRDGYAPSSLKAKVDEVLGNGEELPPELADCLNVGEAYSLRTRK